MRLLITLFFSCLMLTLNAQQTYRVVRGPRPAVDLQSAPESAFKKGVLSIKINENYAQKLDQSPVQIDTRGNVVFGIASIDDLNRSYAVENFNKTFDSDAFQTRFNERHRAWGFHRWYKLYFDANTDIKQMVEDYMASGAVEVAEPEYEKELVVNRIPQGAPEGFSFKGPAWTPTDPRYVEQWHYHNTGQQSGTPDCDIDLPEAWEIHKGDPNVIVAIIDQGVQSTHPDLQAHMWSGIGWNFVNNNANIVAGDHGCHVAGTISAVNNNGVGVSGVAGGSGPDDGVRLMSCQVFNPVAGGGGFELAPVYAADNGASVSQNSWGYTSKGYYEQAVLDAIDYFNVNGGGEALVGGGITIFAAGNDNSSGQWYPGCYSGCFSVAATNNQDKHTWYSNFDTWVDVAAPGGETSPVTARGVLSCWKNSGYGFYEGTSMACPHVSGIAALIASLSYGQFSPDQVAEIIRSTTDNIDALNPGYVGKMGSGRVNANAALLATLELMINVNNPVVFTAIAPTHNFINLNWIKNAENDDVMVAYSPSGSFGDPEHETPYEVNDTLDGGGVIIYKGDGINYAHSGLNSNTLYQYKIWSINDVNEYSMGLEASATTRKTPITQFPYVEPFNPDLFPPLNWENKTVTANALWDIQNTGVDPECLPFSGEAMARFASNDYTAGASAILVSPPVDFINDGYEISFMLFRDAEEADAADRVELYVNNAPTAGFATLLGTVHRSISLAPVVDKADWYKYSVELPEAFYNKQVYLILKGISANGNNLFVDEFTIDLTTNCFPPQQVLVSDIMATTAGVSWQATEPATTWDAEVGVQDFEPGTGTLYEDITETLLALEGLLPATTYDVYLRGVCGSEENSAWTGPVSFTTLCQNVLPWEESFETMTADFTCMQVMANTEVSGGLNGEGLVPVSGEEVWFVNTPEAFGGEGSDYIYEGDRSAAISGNGENFNWLITGELVLPENEPLDLMFMLKYQLNGENQGYFYVNVWDEGNWRPALSYDNPGVESNDFEHPVRVNLDAYQGSTIRLAFVYKSNQSQRLAIDNISFAPATNYWTGTSGNDWNQAENWRLEVPSTTETAVILPAENQPELNTELNQNKIQITEGSSLKLKDGSKLTVTGQFINESGLSGLMLDHGASLIHPEASLPLSADFRQQYDWTLISSPVSGQTFDTTSSAQVWKKWEGSNWVDALVGGEWNPAFEKEFVPGRGYYYGADVNTMVSFAGNSTSASVNTPVSSGWVLLGNPYPSSYRWQPTDLSYAAVAKVADPASGSLIDLYPGGVIPPFAGIMVEVVEPAPAEFAFEASARTHDAAFIPQPATGSMVLNVSESETVTSQQTVIGINPAATEGFDALYDSHFLPMNAPHLYTTSGDEMLSTNTLPGISSGQTIQLGFVKNAASEYKLSISFDPIYTGMVVALHDKVTGEIHDLTSPAMIEFSANEGDDNQRFELVFGTLGIDSPQTTGIKVFMFDDVLHIQGANPGSIVMIHDASGRMINSPVSISQAYSSINLQTLARGWYLVSVRTSNSVQSFKVVKY